MGRKREFRIKHLKREARKKEHHHNRVRNYADAYPQFLIAPVNGPPDKLVKAVEQAAGEINFDSSDFGPADRSLLRIFKRQGFDLLNSVLDEINSQDDGSDQAQFLMFFLSRTGQILHNKLPTDIRERYLLTANLVVIPFERNFVIVVRSLSSISSPHGRIHYSPHSPQVELENQKLTVGFTIHAIKQAYARLVSSPNHYLIANAFEFFFGCQYYELCRLNDGQLAFSLYNYIKGDWSHPYLDEVLGGGADHDAFYGYRVGYCPADVGQGFLVAKTLLFPGFLQTPEHKAIYSAQLPWAQKKEMAEQAKKLTAEYLASTEDYSLLSWFHKNGVPQIRKFDQPLFKDVLDFKPEEAYLISRGQKTLRIVAADH